MYDKDKFLINTDTGENKTFYKLITFKSNITNKTYLVYCDEDKKIYSSILLSNDSNNIKLEKIVDDIDLDEVKKAIIKVESELEEK